ncbi:uncharacterized protein N7518_002131 [Penicillium psychrosexuale]|uniref:uncharacterized protein n=1 Tax=Penicillium psychrosexuale TaxID=1002107 RepID=UPI002545A692|nr:uncharacterized protein N7518_002131 [Penicillium psychrosexuale]KAJ5800063.1 hypothetical protein N7518_002131 [Penicillium psychrosexuale]
MCQGLVPDTELIADCSRGAIKAINQDIEPPNVETQIPQQRASKQDVVGQDLLDAINNLTTNH